jgi:hypothetical protein
MKTTLEVSDELFREAKATAARRGIALRRFVEEALSEKLAREGAPPERRQTLKQWPVPPPDVPSDEIHRIQQLIDEEFEQIEAEDRE